MASSGPSSNSASSRRPTFWGEIVTSEKPYHLNFNNVFTLRLTQAALDPTSSCSTTTTPTSLLCKVGDKPPVIICTLRFESKEDCLLNMEYGGPSNVVFSLQGPGPIHISGYFFCDPPPHPSFAVLPTSPTNEGAVVPISERGAPSQLQNEQDKWYRLLGMTVASQYINHSARSRRASGLLGGSNMDGANASVSNVGAGQHPAITFQPENEIEKSPDKICNDEAAEKDDVVDVQTHDVETERAATGSEKDQTIADAFVCDDNAVLASDACPRQDPDGHADMSPLVSVAELPNTLSVENSGSQRGDSVVHDSAVRRKLDYELPIGQSTMSNKGKEVVSDAVEKKAELLNANQDASNEKNLYEGLGVDPNNSTLTCVGPLEQLEVTVQSPISAEEVTVGAEVNHLVNLLRDNKCSRNAEKIAVDGHNILVEKTGSQSSAEEIAVADEVNRLDDNACTRNGEKIAIDGEAFHPNILVEENRSQGHPEKIATEGEHHLNILDEGRRSQRSLRRRHNRMNDGVGDAGLNDAPSDIDGHLSVPNNTHENVDNTAEDVHLKDKTEGSKGLKHSKKVKSRKRKSDVTGDENARNSGDLSKGIDGLRDDSLEPKDTGASVDSEFVVEKELKPKKKRKRSTKSSSSAHNSALDIIPLDSCNADEINNQATKDSKLIQNVEPGSALERSIDPSDLQELGHIKKKKKKTRKVEGYGVETEDATFSSMVPHHLYESGPIKQKKENEKIEESGVKTEAETGRILRSVDSSDQQESGQIKKKKLKKEKVQEPGETDSQTVRSTGASIHQESVQIKKKKAKKEKVQACAFETEEEESVLIKKKKTKKEKVQASSGVETKEQTVRSMGPSDQQEFIQIKKEKMKKEKVLESGVETKDQTVRDLASNPLSEEHQLRLVGGTSRDFVLALAAVVKP